MASDLASTPRSGLTVQLCGDAHLSNFGMFCSPEIHLLFDVNDFDETGPGPGRVTRRFDKLCHGLEDEPRIISDPPLILPVEKLLARADGEVLLETRITARCRLIGGNC
jgi:Uncharacterized protein conserved in bacteria (DUF2252)